MLHPEEADIDSLAHPLGLNVNSLPEAGSRELEAAAIHARHIDDFRQRRLIEITGWNLSLTELRLAAVIHRAEQV